MERPEPPTRSTTTTSLYPIPEISINGHPERNGYHGNSYAREVKSRDTSTSGSTIGRTPPINGVPRPYTVYTDRIYTTTDNKYSASNSYFRDVSAPSLKQKHNVTSIEKLPPAYNHGLVRANHVDFPKNQVRKQHYHVIKHGERDNGPTRSLPNDSLQEEVEPSPRQAISAPGKKAAHAQKPPAPKVNTYVKGKYGGDESQMKEGSRRADPPQRRTEPKADKDVSIKVNGEAQPQETPRPAPAGMPTKKTATPRPQLPDWLQDKDDQEALRSHEARAFNQGTESKGPAKDQQTTKESESKPKPSNTQAPPSKPWLQKDIFHAPSHRTPNSMVQPADISDSKKPQRRDQRRSEDDQARVEAQKEQISQPKARMKYTTSFPRTKVFQNSEKDKSFIRRKTTFILPQRENTKPKLGEKSKTEAFVRQRSKSNLGERTKTQDIKLASAAAEAPKGDTGEEEKYTIEDAIGIYCREYTRAKTKTNLQGSQPASNVSRPTSSKTSTVKNPYSNPMSRVPPWHRKEYVLTKREATMYKQISKVYSNEKPRKERQNQFYKKLLDVQLAEWRQSHAAYRTTVLNRAETQFIQQQQLRRVRNRFEEEQLQRFRSQYVTGRVLTHEWTTRHEYGLPEDLGQSPQYKVRIPPRQKKPKTMFSLLDTYKKDKRRYHTIFKHRGLFERPNAKPPKMEGVDTVRLEGEDEVDGKQRDVRDIMRDARQLLEDDDVSSDYETTDSDDDENGGRPNQGAKEKSDLKLRISPRGQKPKKPRVHWKTTPRNQPSPTRSQPPTVRATPRPTASTKKPKPALKKPVQNSPKTSPRNKKSVTRPRPKPKPAASKPKDALQKPRGVVGAGIGKQNTNIKSGQSNWRSVSTDSDNNAQLSPQDASEKPEKPTDPQSKKPLNERQTDQSNKDSDNDDQKIPQRGKASEKRGKPTKPERKTDSTNSQNDDPNKNSPTENIKEDSTTDRSNKPSSFSDDGRDESGAQKDPTGASVPPSKAGAPRSESSQVSKPTDQDANQSREPGDDDMNASRDGSPSGQPRGTSHDRRKSVDRWKGSNAEVDGSDKVKDPTVAVSQNPVRTGDPRDSSSGDKPKPREEPNGVDSGESPWIKSKGKYDDPDSEGRRQDSGKAPGDNSHSADPETLTTPAPGSTRLHEPSSKSAPSGDEAKTNDSDSREPNHSGQSTKSADKPERTTSRGGLTGDPIHHRGNRDPLTGGDLPETRKENAQPETKSHSSSRDPETNHSEDSPQQNTSNTAETPKSPLPVRRDSHSNGPLDTEKYPQHKASDSKAAPKSPPVVRRGSRDREPSGSQGNAALLKPKPQKSILKDNSSTTPPTQSTKEPPSKTKKTSTPETSKASRPKHQPKQGDRGVSFIEPEKAREPHRSKPKTSEKDGKPSQKSDSGRPKKKSAPSGGPVVINDMPLDDLYGAKPKKKQKNKPDTDRGKEADRPAKKQDIQAHPKDSSKADRKVSSPRESTKKKREDKENKPSYLEDRDRPDVPVTDLVVTDDEDSDSDEDIFAKAMRKYGIELDNSD